MAQIIQICKLVKISLVKRFGLRALALLVSGALLSFPLYAAPSSNFAGAYLAGYVARENFAFSETAQYLEYVLGAEPENAQIYERLIVAELSRGAFPRFTELMLADHISAEQSGWISEFVRTIVALEQGQAELSDIRGENFIEDVLSGWAYAQKGDFARALQIFSEIREIHAQDYPTHIAEAFLHMLQEDYASANNAFTAAEQAVGGFAQMERRHLIAWIETLSKAEKNLEALEVLNASFQPPLEPEMQALKLRLEAGAPLSLNMMPSALAGASDFLLSVSQSFIDPNSFDIALIYGRLSEFLHPTNTYTLLSNAHILEVLGNGELALFLYDKIFSQGALNITKALIGKAETLANMGNSKAAIDFLKAQNSGEMQGFRLAKTMGDLLIADDHYVEAVEAYNTAISYLENLPLDPYWRIFYARGISYERLGEWEKAEADFRQALELSPNQPQVLNYLGYSLLEKRQKQEEALEMIKAAVGLRPDSGYITDSLAWAYFRLGAFDDALQPMERAVELMPNDPIVNDHLGDIYWAVGRKREAYYQWERALLFDPTPEDGARIRRKLEVGLDVVLADEGDEPLHPVDG